MEEADGPLPPLHDARGTRVGRLKTPGVGRRSPRFRCYPGAAPPDLKHACASGSDAEYQVSSKMEDADTRLDRPQFGMLKPFVNHGHRMRQPWWQRLMWWPGAGDGIPPDRSDSAETSAIRSVGSSAAPLPPSSPPKLAACLGDVSSSHPPSAGASQETPLAATAPADSAGRSESAKRPRTGTECEKLANTYPAAAQHRHITNSVRPDTGGCKLPSTAGSRCGRADTAATVRSVEMAETADRAFIALDEVLKDLPQPEKEEACIALPELGGYEGRIVRGKIDEVMRKQKELVECISGKSRPKLESLKSQQVTWRRKHDALVRKRKERFKMDWSGDDSTSGDDQALHRRCRNSQGLHASAEGARSGSLHPPSSFSRHSMRFRQHGSQAHPATLPLGVIARRTSRNHTNEQQRASLSPAAVGGQATDAATVDGRSDVENSPMVKSKIRTASGQPVEMEQSPRPGTGASKGPSQNRRWSVGNSDGNVSRTPRSITKDGSKHIDKDSTLPQADTFKGSSNDNFLDPQKLDMGLIKPGSMLAKQRGGQSVGVMSDFNYAVNVAKKHNMSVDEVKIALDEFHRLDKDSNGYLCETEFLEVVRSRANLPPHEPVPKHLRAKFWAKADSDNSGDVDFEEFLLWSVQSAYTEEILVTDHKERYVRQLARKSGFALTDVERVKKVFDSFDGDGSGVVDESEFREVLIALMKVKNPADVSEKKMKRFWLEVDTDRSGEINFEEFLLWYFNFFAPY